VETATAKGAAPAIEEGTRLSEDEARAEAWHEQLAACKVDPALWSGVFATNVWAGRYEMDGVLGSGGQGTTFAGTDRKTGARVAVKLLDLKTAGDWKRVELFEREIQTLKSLEHEGMPAYIDEFEDPDTGARALVMTLVPGQSYQAVLDSQGPLAEGALWRVMVDVVDVLRTLHSEEVPVVHRDIKPLNLVKRADGRVCVVDFGGVGQRGAKGSTVVGTFGYMAPEQLYGKSSPATDLYSLGATVLTLATGTQPEDLPRTGLAIDVDQAVPQLSGPLRELLKKMVSPEPGDRPHDARALSSELNAIYDRSTGRATATESAPGPADEAEERDAALDAGTTESDLDEAANVLSAIAYLFVGVLGTVATVLLGEVLLPILFTIATSIAREPNKAKLARARKTVEIATQTAKKGFSESATRGARRLEDADKREKARKKSKRVRRRIARQERHGRHGRRGHWRKKR